METTVTGRHLEITPAIHDYAEKRVAKLPKYYNRILKIEVVVGKAEHHQHEVEIRVWAERVDPFISKVHGDDLYACIDQTVDKLERQLTDHKDKIRHRKGKTSMSG